MSELISYTSYKGTDAEVHSAANQLRSKTLNKIEEKFYMKEFPDRPRIHSRGAASRGGGRLLDEERVVLEEWVRQDANQAAKVCLVLACPRVCMR